MSLRKLCIFWKLLSVWKASLHAQLHCKKDVSFGTGFCPWRPERSWKTSFLGLQFNSVIRWLPLAGLCLWGIYYTRTSLVIALLGAGERSWVFCRQMKGAVWQFLLSSSAAALLTSYFATRPPHSVMWKCHCIVNY